MQDKRRHHRTPLGTSAVCKPADGPAFDCTADDVSLGGMFLTAAHQPKFGEKLTVVVQFPGQSQPFELPAIVRWIREDGFGVQFGLLGARETHAITRLAATKR